jgi:hypothetical protein
MPHRLSHIPLIARIIEKHLKDSQALEPQTMATVTKDEEPNEQKVLVVMACKRDVVSASETLKRYLPHVNILEHGVHSSQKMGLLRAIQVSNSSKQMIL